MVCVRIAPLVPTQRTLLQSSVNYALLEQYLVRVRLNVHRAQLGRHLYLALGRRPVLALLSHLALHSA